MMKRQERRFWMLLRWHEMPLFLGLIITWMALWREISLMSLLSGMLVAILAMRLFYLPPVELGDRFHPWWALRYLFYFLWHLVKASFHVAWLVLRPGPPPRTAIVEVQLRTRSDFLLTLVALTVSLIPGSLVAEVDRYASTLYLHVLDTPNIDAVEDMRKQTLHIESLLIRALGSRKELEGLS